jgi:hypothetical protein
MLGATLAQMPGWCSDLKYAAAMGASVWQVWRPSAQRITQIKKGARAAAARRASLPPRALLPLARARPRTPRRGPPVHVPSVARRAGFAGRPLWLAAQTVAGEEELVGQTHAALVKEWPALLTVVAPAAPGRCAEVRDLLAGGELGLSVALGSEAGLGGGTGGRRRHRAALAPAGRGRPNPLGQRLQRPYTARACVRARRLTSRPPPRLPPPAAQASCSCRAWRCWWWTTWARCPRCTRWPRWRWLAARWWPPAAAPGWRSRRSRAARW